MPPELLAGDRQEITTAGGPGERYARGPAKISPQPGAEAGELPSSYGTDCLILAQRDPTCLHVTWDLPPAKQRRFNAISRDRHMILRMFDTDAGTRPVSEVHVHPESRYWFVHITEEIAVHVAQLGLYTRDGEWIQISTSQPLVVSAMLTASEDPAVFVSLSPEVPLAELAKAVQQAADSGPGQKGLSETIPTTSPETVATASAISNRDAVNPRADRPTTSAARSLPTLFAVHQLQRSRPVEIHGVHFTSTSAPTRPAFARLMAESIIAAQRQNRVVGSMELAGLQEQFGVQIPQGLEGIGISLPEAAKIPVAITSPTRPGPDKPRRFWFNVNAELIVYGATEPDASVTFAGQPICLRPDGSFSFRFSFPDGIYELPVEATSGDGNDTRKAHLIFQRDTDFGGEVGEHGQDASSPAHAAVNAG